MTVSEVYLNEVPKRWKYNPETGKVLNQKNRPIGVKNPATGYLESHLRIDGKCFCLLLHRAAWVLTYGPLPKQIDHVNGDKTDNRICNLREVTRSENEANKVHRWKNSPKGLPGVHYQGSKDNRYNFIINGKIFKDKNPYACFHDLTLLGRMFSERD